MVGNDSALSKVNNVKLFHLVESNPHLLTYTAPDNRKTEFFYMLFQLCCSFNNIMRNKSMYITGADLRKMRQDAGLTTVKMAKLANVKTRKTYENWEKEIGSPSMNQFIAMCVGCNYNSSKFVKLAIERQDPSQQLNISSARR
tara:strand:+ start:220 stop:648 length:429 start_codon:yes stop_codon:yes gene_type:complete